MVTLTFLIFLKRNHIKAFVIMEEVRSSKKSKLFRDAVMKSK